MSQVARLLEALGLFVVAPSRGWQREAKERGFTLPFLFALLLSLLAGAVQTAWSLNDSQLGNWASVLIGNLAARGLPGRVPAMFLTVLLGSVFVFLDAALLRLSHSALGLRGESGSAYETCFRIVAYSGTASLAILLTAPLSAAVGRTWPWSLFAVQVVWIPGAVWRAILLAKGSRILLGTTRAASIEATFVFLALDYSVLAVLALAGSLFLAYFAR